MQEELSGVISRAGQQAIVGLIVNDLSQEGRVRTVVYALMNCQCAAAVYSPYHNHLYPSNYRNSDRNNYVCSHLLYREVYRNTDP